MCADKTHPLILFILSILFIFPVLLMSIEIPVILSQSFAGALNFFGAYDFFHIFDTIMIVFTPNDYLSNLEEHLMNRKPHYPVDDIFVNRWSPRALSGELLTDKELMTLFEAARWAPSSYNNQPWRFLYAKRDTKHWDTFYNLMVEFNQTWTKNAAVLVVAISHNIFEFNHKPARTH